MTAAMVAEIVETFDALEADDEHRRGRGHRRAARVLLGRRRRRARLARRSGRTTASGARSCSIYEGFLRVLRSPLPTVAAVNGPAVGAGLQPRARVRRPHRGRVGALRHPLPAHRPASRRRPHVDARAGGRPAGRGRDGAVRRAGRRRPRGRDRPRVGVPSRRRARRAGDRVRRRAPRPCRRS